MSKNRTKPTISEAKRKANIANAAKSTGPRTEAGKAKVSQNALKHGLLAESSPLREGPHNISIDPKLYEQTLSNFAQDLHPTNNFELALVQRLAHLHLRLQRAHQMEDALLERELTNTIEWADQTPADFPDPDSPASDSHLLAETYTKSAKALNLLSHYEARLSRDFARTLKQLRDSQSSTAGVSLRTNSSSTHPDPARDSQRDPTPPANPDPISPTQEFHAKQTQPPPQTDHSIQDHSTRIEL